jgi:hypothetical protein
MSDLERRLAVLEECRNPKFSKDMTDTELALRLYWACNGPEPIGKRLLEIVPQLAVLSAPTVTADPV